MRSMLKGMLTFEMMSKGMWMLMVMLKVMLSWVGGGGDGHLFRRGGHRTRDHETREAFSNRLRSTIASTTDLFNLFYVVEITGDQQ